MVVIVDCHLSLIDYLYICAENPDYAGYIIPPAPPRPDFDASREKLQKLGEAESGQLTKVSQGDRHLDSHTKGSGLALIFKL